MARSRRGSRTPLALAFVLACVPVAGLVGARVLGWLGPTPEPPAPASAPPPRVAPAPEPEAPPSAVAERDPHQGIPRTQLPLRLLGTAVSEDASRSLAAVEDTELGDHQILGEGQLLHERPGVHLARIESDRVLLDNEGVLEQLPIDRSGTLARAEAADPAGYAPSEEERARRRALSQRLRALTDAGTDYLAEANGERGGLLAEGRVAPVYEGGQMVGLQVDDIRAGGFYEKLGLHNGDLVTSINGVALGEPGATAAVLAELAGSGTLNLDVEDSTGAPRTVTAPTPEVVKSLRAFE